jgi:hypothetical protein
VEYAGGNKTEDELALAYADSVAGVVAPLIASDDVEVRRQDVDDLAFSFIAPLGASYNDVFHIKQANSVKAVELASAAGFAY